MTATDVLNAGTPMAGIVKLVAEGGVGADTLRFSASGENEKFDIAANGERVLLFRDMAALAMDLNDVETINFNAGAAPTQ